MKVWLVIPTHEHHEAIALGCKKDKKTGAWFLNCERNYQPIMKWVFEGSVNDLKRLSGQAIKRKKKPNNRSSSVNRKRRVFDPATTLPKYSHPLLGKPEYKDFYKSIEWRQLRYIALKNNGASCQCCGAKAGNGVQIHVDHIKPRSRYPELELCLDNLQILCEDCNVAKGSWDDTDWR